MIDDDDDDDDEVDDIDDGEARSESETGLNKNEGLVGMSRPLVQTLSLFIEARGETTPLAMLDDRGEWYVMLGNGEELLMTFDSGEWLIIVDTGEGEELIILEDGE